MPGEGKSQGAVRPLFKKYGVDIFGGETLLGAGAFDDGFAAEENGDDLDEAAIDQIGEAQLGKLLLKTLLKNA